LKNSKPGYGLLGKKRRRIARIIEIPEKLNLKVEKIEADEKKHFLYRSKPKKKHFF
jgi:hypothetical protein